MEYINKQTKKRINKKEEFTIHCSCNPISAFENWIKHVKLNNYYPQDKRRNENVKSFVNVTEFNPSTF